MYKRAMTYLKRKYKRSILLLILLFVLAFSLAVSLMIWSGINAAVQETERNLGTSFVVKTRDQFPPGTLKTVQLKDGGAAQRGVIPRPDQEVVDAIMQQVDGITAYHTEQFTNVYSNILELIEGGWGMAYQERLDALAADPDAENNNPNTLTIDDYAISSQTTTIYGNNDSELFSYFRTGALTLADGKHIRPDDTGRVMISDVLAEQNGVQVGDTITIQLLGDMWGARDNWAVWSELELEIVGLFHVNGYQPINRLVYENYICNNWFLVDMNTCRTLHDAGNRNYYIDYEEPFYYNNITFFVEDSDQLDEIIAEVESLDAVDTLYLEAIKDDTMYKSTVEPLNSIKMLVLIAVAVIAIGCFIVLCIVFTMWIRSRRREIAIYLSLGIRKAEILGQFIIEAAVVAVAASVVAFAICQPVAGAIGNSMLSSAVAEAAPEEKEYSQEELYELAVGGDTTEEFNLDSGTYAGPEHIDFQFGLAEMLILVAAEFLIIIVAICKGGSFIFKLQPRQIMTTLS